VENARLRFARLGISQRFCSLEWKTNVSERYVGLAYKSEYLVDYLGQSHGLSSNIGGGSFSISNNQLLSFTPAVVISNIQSIDLSDVRGFSFTLINLNENTEISTDGGSPPTFTLTFKSPTETKIFGLYLLTPMVDPTQKTMTFKLPMTNKFVGRQFVMVSDGYTIFPLNKKIRVKKKLMKQIRIRTKII
jgi:hypothetical protein